MTDAETRAVKRKLAVVKSSRDLFKPAGALPVLIDFVHYPTDPYQLAENVTYENAIVNVPMEKGFRWDGASIPVWWPLALWLLNLLIAHYAGAVWMWFAAIPLLAYTYRLLPYMQKMGLHARAACVHDKLYRTQPEARIVCDGILLSIMEGDGVPFDIRWQIYTRVRAYGWVAWRANAEKLKGET